MHDNFCFSIFFCILSIVCYIKDFKKPLDQTDQRFLELYADLKDKKTARFYSNMYYFRRFLMWGIIILPSSIPILLKAILFTLLQLLSALYMLSFPFEKVRDNIIELGNDFLLFLLTLAFTICYAEDMCNNQKQTDAVIYILTFNGLFINCVIISDALITLFKVS